MTSNWAPAQCLDNATHYEIMLEQALAAGDKAVAAFVVYWMDDARWDVAPVRAGRFASGEGGGSVSGGLALNPAEICCDRYGGFAGWELDGPY